MPDLYGRATCATELKIRDSILQKIREGWKPTGPLEVPNTHPNTQNAESPSADSTSVLSPEDEESAEIDISDLNVYDVAGSRGYV